MNNKKLFVKTNISHSTLSDSENLTSYLKYIHAFPILSIEKEKELLKNVKYKNDINAAHQLVESHLRFVVKIAKSFSGYGLSIFDLIQEGNIGLLKSIKKFNLDIDVRLVSFAVHWIKAEMYNYIIKNWKIVKIATTRDQRKLFFNLRSSKKNLGWFNNEEINNLSNKLGILNNVIVDMESRMKNSDMSFDAPVNGARNNNEFDIFPDMFLSLPNSNPEYQVIKDDLQARYCKIIHNSINKLDPRSKNIIESRWFGEKKETLLSLSKKFNISLERIRQIEEESLQKLKLMIKKYI